MCKFASTYYDEVAIRNSYTDKNLVTAFSLEDVERFLRSLGVQDIDVQDDYLVCPTICHNPIDEADNMKLYYYDKTKNFHCYTQCSENFSVISLYQRYMELNHQKVSYDEAIYYLRKFLTLQLEDEGEVVISPRAIEVNQEPLVFEKASVVSLPEYNKNVLDYFLPMSHPSWLDEGITSLVQEQFNIRFSYEQNKIIIPHYDIKGRLVGVRARAFEEEDLKYGKYRPVQIGSEMYNHQLGFNLYGIWEHKEAIQRSKRVVIYEGEKSVLKDSSYYGPYSVAVATCGSQLNRFQINLLVQELGVNEIILAYDKEYKNCFDIKGREYRKKLIGKCEKYRGLATFYYLFDEHNLLDMKDAPCDKGRETLEKLMKRRIIVR